MASDPWAVAVQEQEKQEGQLIEQKGAFGGGNWKSNPTSTPGFGGRGFGSFNPGSTSQPGPSNPPSPVNNAFQTSASPAFGSSAFGGAAGQTTSPDKSTFGGGGGRSFGSSNNTPTNFTSKPQQTHTPDQKPTATRGGASSRGVASRPITNARSFGSHQTSSAVATASNSTGSVGFAGTAGMPIAGMGQLAINNNAKTTDDSNKPKKTGSGRGTTRQAAQSSITGASAQMGPPPVLTNVNEQLPTPSHKPLPPSMSVRSPPPTNPPHNGVPPSNPPYNGVLNASGDASANGVAETSFDKGKSLAEASLVNKVVRKSCSEGEDSVLNKYLRSRLIELGDNDVEVMQMDPHSPLFSIKSFDELHLSEELTHALAALKFRQPSKIQETALPILLATPPQNMIAQSQSGTGKTAAFVLTMLMRARAEDKYPQCLCLAPTFELAEQIGADVEAMAQFTSIKVALAVRGEKYKVPRGSSVEAQIVIGTPGTVLDWVTKLRLLDPKKIDVFVLDEADVMISQQGHQDQSVRIKNQLREDCQMMLFSATYDNEVIKFAEYMVPNANMITLVRREDQALDSIKQYWVKCDSRDAKFEAIDNMYSVLTIGKAIIFCHTRKSASWLAEKMSMAGHGVALLSGDLDIEQRAAVIARFKTSAEDKVLITTNVVARGLDVEGVTVVVNYDLPLVPPPDKGPDFDVYVHRIGRTGRFGRKGIAINLIDSQESKDMLIQIEDNFKREIKELDTNSIQELQAVEESSN